MTADQVSQALEQREREAAVARVLDQLPPLEQELCRRHAMAGESLRQIARDWGLPEGRVKRRWRKLRARLQQELRGLEP